MSLPWNGVCILYFCKIVRCLEHGNIEHQRLPQVSVAHLDIIVNKVCF